MIVRVIGVVLAVASAAGPASAQNSQTYSKLRGICVDLSTQTFSNNNPKYYSYAFEEKIYAAAEVDFARDTAAVARTKIQKMWRDDPLYLHCQANNFNLRDGHILKYAIATRSFNLIDDAIYLWGVDLNIVDSFDNRTLLDYTESQRKRYEGTPMEPDLASYIKILRSHGARYRSELK